MTSTGQPRVLVVEDEGVVLIAFELALAELGFDVAGCASDLETGLALASSLTLDIALLDVNLAGRDSGPIADVLAARAIPFVFASGYTRSTLPARHAARPLLSKPFSDKSLGDALSAALANAKSPGR
ncbi:MAG: response regulator [Hyphomicrobiaceae bacterium]|nr:response regulator [Hyphomicrobiaceae bacterium]